MKSLYYELKIGSLKSLYYELKKGLRPMGSNTRSSDQITDLHFRRVDAATQAVILMIVAERQYLNND